MSWGTNEKGTNEMGDQWDGDQWADPCADGEENLSGSDRSLRLRNENNDLRKNEAPCNFQWI